MGPGRLWRFGTGCGTLGEVRDGLWDRQGGPALVVDTWGGSVRVGRSSGRGPGRDGGPSGRFGRGRGTLTKVRKGRGTHGGPGQVGGALGRSGMG